MLLGAPNDRPCFLFGKVLEVWADWAFESVVLLQIEGQQTRKTVTFAVVRKKVLDRVSAARAKLRHPPDVASDWPPVPLIPVRVNAHGNQLLFDE